ncbi:MAG TPA: alginate lyase family protein, partial [Vicinamibacterales bacterium]|nr:alginate lyase family protein [Vicinamibacterales bacterium]
MIGPDSVMFLNVTGSVDWNDQSRDRLWLYNLHYFDDLTARGFEERRAWHESLVHRWILENRPGVGAGWEPYPTSLRIANWIKWTLASDTLADQQVLESMATQVRWLGKRMETHLLGNHLWANAKALVAAGLFFDGAEADAWRDRGLGLLRAEIDEQILPDGGHFERSPMYHAIVLEDILDLAQLSDIFPDVLPLPFVAQLKSVATRMLRWLRVMSHPDGLVSFFNDAAFGVAAPWSVLADQAQGLAIDVDREALQPLEALPDSGYVRLENERATVLCDVAPVGPDYQPAHAHADTLSFELSVDGRRVVVNGGTSTYAPGPERMRQRGTAAHSTVEIDQANSSDVWGGFRVARRAR